MNKLNNKGMTIIEVIVSFTALMVLVLGMLNMTNEIKTTSKQKQFYKELQEYSNLLQSTIQDDLIMDKLKTVEECASKPSDAEICLELKFEDNSVKKLIINIISNEEDDLKIISYNDLKYTIPGSDYINNLFNTDFGGSGSADDNYLYYKNENNLFVLNVPIYEDLYGDGKTNFGFKIVHPIEVED